MTDIGQMFQQMQNKILAEQEKLNQTEITGSAGGGLVEVTITGKNIVKRVKIDPSLIVADETAILEDLLVAAVNDALRKTEAEMAKGVADLLPPGMKLPF
ncbi:MAG: YbaB/EbfC family nucleoid-associated protein [Alphaproteobacteria bacterium]|nr:YbaB/EbfC family nucleoid-associated protein [Alphaproteobacteria bacterium]MBO4644224.1 YbaB/EbfC family nucleoid-associated protein [Alphaproteobacteria bacterium]